jgi:hypothetical protein
VFSRARASLITSQGLRVALHHDSGMAHLQLLFASMLLMCRLLAVYCTPGCRSA